MNKKFRIWDKLAKTFIFPDKGYQGHYVLDLNGRFHNLHNGSGGDECVVQQWTGFLDKNDQEIYEGDIVVYSPQLNSGEVKCEVSSCAGGFRLARLHSKKGVLLGAFVEVGGKTEALQVVGNIFENPLDNEPQKP